METQRKIRRAGVIAAVAAALICGASGRAGADTHDIASSGNWTAYQGTDQDGTEICGIDTSSDNNPHGDQIDLKYYNGDDYLTVQLFSTDWTIPDGNSNTHIDITFDQNTPWHVDQVTGMHIPDGTAGMEFTIGKSDVADFLTEFAQSSQIAIDFTNSDVSNWTGDLTGTQDVVLAFTNCIRDLPDNNNQNDNSTVSPSPDTKNE